jgi:hypothetical protein
MVIKMIPFQNGMAQTQMALCPLLSAICYQPEGLR